MTMRTEEEIRAWIKNFEELSEWVGKDKSMIWFAKGLKWVLNDKEG